MLTLYPEIEPYARHRLAVDHPPHELYLEESGNPDGIPVIVVHGGPGGGCEDYHRRFFDAERFRIILLDQRGAGRSTPPLAELEGNSTDKLVEDLEAVRHFLGIDRWLLFGGGSWGGSTLSLVYAETHLTGFWGGWCCGGVSFCVGPPGIFTGFIRTAPAGYSRITGRITLPRFRRWSATIWWRPTTGA